LREFCESEADLRVVGEYGDGAAALAAIRLQQPQLLFLDVQMSPLNGIELARSLEPSQLPSLVFVTAYDTYAVEAFEVSAVDYLLKPFDQDAFAGHWNACGRGMPRPEWTNAGRFSPVCLRNWNAPLGRQAKSGPAAGGIRRPPARARRRSGGNDRGGSQLRRHPGGKG